MSNRFFKHALVTVALAWIVSCMNAQSKYALTASWGEFGEKPGQLKFPTMIATDKNKFLYVVDQHNHRIQKFDSAGTFITLWGGFGNGDGQFAYPFGIAIDSRGNVFVSDMNNHRIQKFTPEGRFVASTGSYGSGNGQLKFPYGVAINADDVLFVIDAFNYRVQKFSSELEFISTWGSAESIGIKLYMPHEIAVTPQGTVLMSDRQNHRIAVFTSDGKLVKHFGDYAEGHLSNGGSFSEPHGIAIGSRGDIFISDRYNFRIQQFDSKSNFRSQWYTPGGFDDSKHFPLGIAAGSNVIYVTDHYSHKIHQYKGL